MSSSAWPRYPPCVSDSCTDPGCCSPAYKYEWPELVGETGKKAKATIEKDNPSVTVLILPFGSYGLMNYCCNRVYVFLDEGGKVRAAPHVG